jgi:hypothetical protein
MKSIPPTSGHLSPGCQNPFGAAIVLASALARIVFQPSLSKAQSLASVSFSLKQSSAEIRGTTRLTAAATYANCSSCDVSSNITLSSVDARVVRIASGSATGTFATTASYQWKNATAFMSSSIGNIHCIALRAISATRETRICIRQRSP